MLTIGHSRHSIERFLELLRQYEVEVLVDVRSQPASRFSPQFTRKPLELAVIKGGLRYLFLGDLVGGRPQARECYTAEGALSYDLVEEQPFYQRGIARLVEGEASFRICLMCAEENPAHCHRHLLITRTLRHQGLDVRHVRGDGSLEPASAFDEAPADPAQLSLFRL